MRFQEERLVQQRLLLGVATRLLERITAYPLF